jgi:hypothetical protein
MNEPNPSASLSCLKDKPQLAAYVMGHDAHAVRQWQTEFWESIRNAVIHHGVCDDKAGRRFINKMQRLTTACETLRSHLSVKAEAEIRSCLDRMTAKWMR